MRESTFVRRYGLIVLAGILVGIVFLKKGFTLGRAYPVKTGEGFALPAVMLVLPGHGPVRLGLHSAGGMSPAAADPGGRGQRGLRRDGAGHDDGGGGLP